MEAYRANILVIDDEESNLLAMKKILEQEAYQVVTARQAAMALTLFRRQAFDLVLTDLRMPGVSGLELLRAIRKENSSVPVVMLTAYGTVNDAVEAMKHGAVDFLSKPLRRETILKCVLDTLAKSAGGPQAREQRARTQFLGNCPTISQVKKTIRMLARTSASVLVEGESGTGKEIVANAIHSESARQGRMVSVNCGAIPETLLESELFGYEKGAFTGAVNPKPGLFELADKGTLFLDEIGEMSLSLQVKLLRVLQDGMFFRLGGTEQKKVDVRIIAATNNDLKRRILESKFREDLYYRLNVVSLQLPPLRERGDDIQLLADHFLDLARESHGKKGVTLSAEARRAIECYGWPGNVRELRNSIERTLVMLDGEVIRPADLGLPEVPADSALAGSPKPLSAATEDLRFPLGTSLHEIELEAIRKTLEFTGGDKVKAAEILGINQRTIYRKLAEL
ncbi:MAG TPA: sigma-54 dependent transcriptional regulator [Bdellovibrionota bacterium]|jgi:two-component system response regulator HydG